MDGRNDRLAIVVLTVFIGYSREYQAESAAAALKARVHVKANGYATESLLPFRFKKWFQAMSSYLAPGRWCRETASSSRPQTVSSVKPS